MPISRSKNRRRAEVTEPPAPAGGPGRAWRWGRRLLQALVAAALLVGLGFAGKEAHRWALTTPTFAVARIDFRGLARATDADLLKISGLAPGMNLLDLDVRALERAMATHPWVKEVAITRHLPTALEVKVVEHRPVAMVSLGDLYLLDDLGEPFKKVQAQDALDLPLVTGVDRDAYVARPEETAGRFQRALEVATAYADGGQGNAGALSEVRLEGAAVTLVTGDGQEVRLGSDEVLERLAQLPRVRGELKKRGITAEVIHLDNRARPAWVTVSPSVSASERSGEPAK